MIFYGKNMKTIPHRRILEHGYHVRNSVLSSLKEKVRQESNPDLNLANRGRDMPLEEQVVVWRN